MRENPEKGKFFFKNFETELMQNRLTYGIVKGEGEERLKNAIEIIENRFS